VYFKKKLFILIFIFSNVSFAHDLSRFSYYSIITKEIEGNYYNKLSNKCKRRLKKFFKKGSNLKIKELNDKAELLNMYVFKQEYLRNKFYHYTNSDAARESASLNNIDTFFEYPRVLNPNEDGFNNIFIAKDPYSSSAYGNIQLQFYFSKEARILRGTDQLLKRTVLEAFPRLAVCWGDIEIQNQENSFLSLVLEENDIDLYAYFEGDDWYQIIKRDHIVEVSVGVFEEI
jgi:hypothetical protein